MTFILCFLIKAVYLYLKKKVQRIKKRIKYISGIIANSHGVLAIDFLK